MGKCVKCTKKSEKSCATCNKHFCNSHFRQHETKNGVFVGDPCKEE